VSAVERAKALLDLARTRGEVKRLAIELDADPDLRRAVLEEGRRRGADLPEEALEWPSAKLLRRARALEEPSRQRTNPVRRDEAFVCAHCGLEVEPLRRTDRDHCPRCLRSLHVDVVPGDRASTCGGLMDPVGAEIRGGDVVIHHRCRRCGAPHRVRAAVGDPLGDDWDALVRTSAGEPPP
jgi:predicted RNA-binding Zn-ribbon protein involved in translation (DUF1610 family)